MKKNFEVNERILEFMKKNRLQEADLVHAGIDRSTAYRITGMESKPTRTTIKLIADHFGADFDYLWTGKTRQDATNLRLDMPWKDEAYSLLKQQIQELKEINAWLRSMIQMPGKSKVTKLAELHKSSRLVA